MTALGSMIAVPFFTIVAVLLWPLFRVAGLPL
jgi:hypothetical protein